LYLQYQENLSPSNHHLSPALKKHFEETNHKGDRDVQAVVTRCVMAHGTDRYRVRTEVLVSEYLNCGSDYVGK
jgi:hypothetical protein